ncbi:hypothetical protein ACO02O_00100 [Dirofilaria immitis]
MLIVVSSSSNSSSNNDDDDDVFVVLLKLDNDPSAGSPTETLLRLLPGIPRSREIIAIPDPDHGGFSMGYQYLSIMVTAR